MIGVGNNEDGEREMKIIDNKEIQRVPILAWTDEIDSNALEQAMNLSQLGFVYQHVALMPDVHLGYGMPIGGVIACDGVVIPNAVGVDIGCGMIAVKTSLSVYDFDQDELPEILKRICHQIHRSVPLGFNVHNSNQSWPGFNEYLDNLEVSPGWMSEDKWDRAQKSVGTLGGGNHFIEIQQEINQHGDIWLMIHSGSRNLGKVIADYYHKKAIEFWEDNEVDLKFKDLAHLPLWSVLAKEYLKDMTFALDFAQENRDRMMEKVQEAVVEVVGGLIDHDIWFENPINIHHNFAVKERHFSKDVWIHRKGATSAKRGQKGIIPGSMGTPSFIVEGRGNPFSFESCSHGAGRKMGRMDASRRLDPEDCEIAMSGIVFDGFGTFKKKKMKGKKDLGESPLAYKDIALVMDNQCDLVKILHELRPIENVKG